MVLNISTLLLSYGVSDAICHMYHRALGRHDSYRIIITYAPLYVNEIQHYFTDFNEVFVVVFVRFVLVFIWNVIFELTFDVLTAILDLIRFLSESREGSICIFLIYIHTLSRVVTERSVRFLIQEEDLSL